MLDEPLHVQDERAERSSSATSTCPARRPPPPRSPRGDLGRDKSLLDTDLDVWERTLDVNVLGYVRTARAVLPHLLDNGGSSIVNCSSGAAVSAGDRKRPAYGASSRRSTRSPVISPGGSAPRACAATE
ncbi:SDR family NAD(P)-dependent oxidoreductase [Nonomuraea sp. CA-141351]|uniref:SDR family NAD(P)-dependent oxidoreductase n=1 Tax=Nonomuraea sp. CA-141351 TaxID=3239996 RepID=UPI003D8FCDCC